uniref:Uncharacterized protein n=1 Tax=viral metagenome TaxID=1070528 RepID=A0A6H1ZIW9_9ZZZZ
MKNKLMLMLGIVLLAFVVIVFAVAPNQPILNNPANNSMVYGTTANLNITVTDNDSGYLNVSFYSWAYTGISYYIGSEETQPQGIHWDGTNWWIGGNSKTFKYYSNWTYTGDNYTLYHYLGFTVSNAKDFFWNGTNWFVAGGNYIYKYNSNWIYIDRYYLNGGNQNGVYGDGTNWWVISNDNDIVYKYNSDWSDNTSFYIGSEDTDPKSVDWDGTNWWIVGGTNGKVFKYYSNWTYTGDSYFVSNPSSFDWDGTNWWLVSAVTDRVYKYTNYLIGNATNISNNSYATYNWTSLADGDYEWYAITTDGIDTTTSPIYSFSIYDYNYTTTHDLTVLETSSQTFTLNITRDPTYIDDGNATLHWNGTAYPVDAVVYPTYLWFSKTLTIPSIDTTTVDIVFNWSYEFWNPANNSRETNRTEDFTQKIYDITFDDCSAYSIVALNFSLIEESNNASIAGDMDFTFSLVGEDITINYSNSVTNVSSTAFCIPTNEVSFTAQLQSEYTASAYADFTYFAYNLAITNTTSYIYYYLVNGTTIVEFTVLDQSGNEIENAYIKVMKYDIGTGLYKTIEVLKTDELGKALGNIVLDTAWYKFMVEYGGTLYLHTSATKMTSTTRTFTINLLSDFFDRYTDVIYNIYSTLNFTDATGNFAFTYSDPAGNYHQGCLKVTKEGLAGQTLINETCVSSTAATILVNVNSSGSVNGTYTAVGYIMFDDMYVLRTLSKTWGHLSDVYGKEGLFYVFLIVLTCVMVGIFSPKLAIILGIIGLVFSNILGFVFINVGWLVAIIIAAGLTLYRMRD